jgi:hypothetical protein
MVKIDFTDFREFSTCPAWWRNLVTDATKDLEQEDPAWSNAIVAALQEYGAVMDDTNSCLFNYVMFEDEMDFLACKLKWDYEDGC